MTSSRDIPSWAYKLLILLTTIVWGSGFVVAKDAMEAVGPCWLLVVRFGLAAAVLAVALWPQIRAHLDRSHLVAGGMIGLTGGAGYLVQHLGLAESTPATTAFLTATYCVMVPFVHWAHTRVRPGANCFVAAVLCLVGIYFVTAADGGGLSALLALKAGDVLALLCAFFFALEIEVIDHYASAHDTLTLSVVQVAVICPLCALGALLTHEAPPAAANLSPVVVVELAYLTLVGTALATLTQNLGQKHVEASQAGLLMSLESVFGVLFSVAFYHETVTPSMLVGFVAIFVSVVVSEVVGSYNGGAERPL